MRLVIDLRVGIVATGRPGSCTPIVSEAGWSSDGFCRAGPVRRRGRIITRAERLVAPAHAKLWCVGGRGGVVPAERPARRCWNPSISSIGADRLTLRSRPAQHFPLSVDRWDGREAPRMRFHSSGCAGHRCSAETEGSYIGWLATVGEGQQPGERPPPPNAIAARCAGSRPLNLDYVARPRRTGAPYHQRGTILVTACSARLRDRFGA
jgi:hypothetical protein